MSNTCKYEKYRRYASYDNGETWQALDEYQRGELIEYDSVDCGGEHVTYYRWVNIPLAEDYYCSGTTKYYKQKKQKSTDEVNWSDVVPLEYRMGFSAESQSSDCGYATRVTSGSPYCTGVDKYIDVYSQVSDDSGTTWYTTATTPTLLEHNSEDCGYVPPAHDYSEDYFTIKAIEDGTFSYFRAPREWYGDYKCSYSKDGGETWSQFTSGARYYNNYEDVTTLNAGEKLLFKGGMYNDSGNYYCGCFLFSGKFEVEGNALSLHWYDDFKNETYATNEVFRGLLHDNTTLINAKNLVLPATHLATRCYEDMFEGCTNLITPPTILPASKLEYGCYNRMFSGCTSLTTAPIIMAKSFGSYSCQGMFSNCSSLSAITCLATNISATACTSGWVGGVAPSGVFTKDASMSGWTIDSPNGVPSGWTIVNESNRVVSGTPYCDGMDKKVDVYHQVSTDNGLTWTTTSTTVSISYDSVDCGYVPAENYLTLIALDSGTFTRLPSDFRFSLDGGRTWRTTLYEDDRLHSGDTIMLKSTTYSGASYNYISSTMPFEAKGNIMSLIYGDNFIGKTNLNGHDFISLFAGSKIVDAKDLILPATTLTTNCYQYMFKECGSLRTAPQLPATTLNTYCYEQMFYGCTSLTTAPELLATTLAPYCYNNMFMGCSSLTTAPSTLPATTLENSCYASMFWDCSSLTTAPEIYATTVASGCCGYMFYNCTSLTTAPTLLATTLENSCYNRMFKGCTNLSNVTCLATDISASNCTRNWLNGVSSSGTFTKAAGSQWGTSDTGIPSGWTVVEKELYYRTTSGSPYCDGVDKYIYVYDQISYDSGSTWTTTATTTTLLEQNSADCGYAERTISGSPYCDGHDKKVDVYSQVSTDSGTTWTTTATTSVVIEYGASDCGDEAKYLTFKTVQNGTFSFTPYQSEKAYSSYTLSYSINGGSTWTELTSGSSTPTVQSGSTIIWKGTMSPTPSGGEWKDFTIGQFSSTGRFEVEGNIMSLLYGDNFSGQTSLSGYNYVFSRILSTSNLTNAENLALPATTLAKGCYANMFYGCTNLAYPPSNLPATSLVESCYNSMFAWCSSLNYCPWLPATTLGFACYREMFYNCTNIVYSPMLQADTLTDYCYDSMFNGCTNLSNVTCLATDISASNCTRNWLNGVSSSGTFTKDVNATFWTTGVDGIPSNWTVVNA